MTEIYEIVIPGKPLGWQRAGQNHKTGAVYTQEQTRDQETAIAWEFKRKYPGKMIPKGWSVYLYITASFPIPKKTTKAKAAKMLSGEIRPTVKPDWDNIGKLVGDALNGVAYDDDKSIVTGVVRKEYSAEPQMKIEIICDSND